MVFKLKQWLFWICYRIDQWLPMRLRVAMRNRCAPWGKPILDVAEIHVADHCNLNCTGCLHFTPFARKWFADPERIGRDVAALRSHFRFIRHVTLLGGEPLLHPNCEKVVLAVKNASPESLITIVTNGVILKGETLYEFVDMCKRHEIRVKWTIYPPFRDRKKEAIEVFENAGINFFTMEVGDFYVTMNPAGGDAGKSMHFCRKTTYCPYLRDGRLYTCAQAFHIRDYIDAYERATGTNAVMRQASGLDVYDGSLSGWRILEYLMTPCETCRFCADKPRYIKWSQGCRDVTEWESNK